LARLHRPLAAMSKGLLLLFFKKKCFLPVDSTTKPCCIASVGAVFPKAIAAKYIKESAGNARRDTCLDQYKANKATSGNGGLRWIQKGGGYYSVCSTKLKG
jgi:hypothetical protein